MNRANRITSIVIARQQRFSFGREEFVPDSREQVAQFVQRRFVFFRKFKQNPSVGNLSFEFFLSLDRSLCAAALL